MSEIAGQFRTIASPYAAVEPQEKAADPAPSRLGYKLQRLWLTPLFRVILRTGLPAIVMVLVTLIFVSQEGNLAQFDEAIAEAKASVQARPEFLVNELQISGASDALADEITQDLPFEFPFSSFDLDVEIIRAELEDLVGVDAAVVRITPQGVLQVNVKEVAGVALWRNRNGLFLLSDTGEVLRPAGQRSDHSHMPLIAGDGAPKHLQEVAELLAEVSVIKSEIRGFVRIGERRWDLILSGDRRIALPENSATEALRHVILLTKSQNLLHRDVAIVDFRNPRRPTVRLRGGALQNLEGSTQVSIEGISQ